jgi:hypothetical protein
LAQNLHIFCWEPIRAHPKWTKKDSCIFYYFNGTTIGSSSLGYPPIS